MSVSFSTHRGQELPMSRGVVVTQSLVPTVYWWIVKPATSLLSSVCCLSFVIVGRYGTNQQIVRFLDLNKIMAFFLLAIAWCLIVAGCGYLYIADKYANAVDCFLRIPIAIIMAAGVYFEAHFLRACWIAMLHKLALQFYLMFLVYGPSHGAEPWPIFTFSLLVVLAGLQFLRWRTKWMHFKELKKSLAGYERAWTALCRSDRETRDLQALSRSVDIQGTSEHMVLRQMQRKHTSNLTEVFSIDRSKAISKTLNPVFKDIRFFPISTTISTSSKVTSLDQLYAQASVCSIVLAKKVREWAQETDGYLTKAPSIPNMSRSRVSFSSGGAEYVRPSEVDEGSYLEYAARAIKSRKRALVKLMMCYGGDPSRLLDLARNRIAFDTVADLNKCFLKICADPDVVIERVKNRLTRSYNHERTGGYRDLCINLRITEDSITEMGAETHICELQLALTCFTNSSNLDSHRRFTSWRRYSSTSVI